MYSPPQDEPLDLKVRKFPSDTHYGNPQVPDTKNRSTKTHTNVGLLECSSLPAGIGLSRIDRDRESPDSTSVFLQRREECTQKKRVLPNLEDVKVRDHQALR